MAGIWLASGLVIIDQVGIRKRVLFYSRSFRWSEITEIRLHRKQGGAVEIRAGSKKLTIDYRVVSFEDLQARVIQQSGLKRSSEDHYVRA